MRKYTQWMNFSLLWKRSSFLRIFNKVCKMNCIVSKKPLQRLDGLYCEIPPNNFASGRNDRDRSNYLFLARLATKNSGRGSVPPCCNFGWSHYLCSRFRTLKFGGLQQSCRHTSSRSSAHYVTRESSDAPEPMKIDNARPFQRSSRVQHQHRRPNRPKFAYYKKLVITSSIATSAKTK